MRPYFFSKYKKKNQFSLELDLYYIESRKRLETSLFEQLIFPLKSCFAGRQLRTIIKIAVILTICFAGLHRCYYRQPIWCSFNKSKTMFSLRPSIVSFAIYFSLKPYLDTFLT